MRLCDDIKSVNALDLTVPWSQYNPATGEFLGDPSGHHHLYLVRTGHQWGAYSRKHELPDEAFEEFDDVGLALQLVIGDSNGYISPFKNIVIVPAGMRAKIVDDRVQFVRDDLRDFLKDNWKPARTWDDDLLAWPDADASDTTQLLSGGMDSVGCLLSHELMGRKLPALHIARPGFEHELAFAQETAKDHAVRLDVAHFRSVQPDEAFADIEYSPFGRAFNFAMYQRAMREALQTQYAVHGELSLMDMQFADHADRFRHVRRAFYHQDHWRKTFRMLQPVARHLPSGGDSGKIGNVLRSLQTATSKPLYLLGTFIGPRGLPGIARAPFVLDETEFLAKLEARLSELVNPSLDKQDFEIDYFLMAFRYSEGNSNLVGPQEAAASLGKATRHPMNKLYTLLRQATAAPDVARDKTILKQHFHAKFPHLKSVVWFKKNCALGERAPLFAADAPWQSTTDRLLSTLPKTPYISNGDLGDFLRGQPWLEHHIHVTSLLKRREDARARVSAGNKAA